MKKKFCIVMLSLFACLSMVLPLKANEIDDLDLQVNSQNIVMLDMNTMDVVFERGMDERIYPASMTKLMSALVAVDKIADLNETITFDEASFEGLIEANASLAGFSMYETVTYKDLLYGILLPSGAEACMKLAQSIAGSEQAYVQLMNEKAQEMGLRNTHFVNTTGLHEDEHYSTVYEIGLILKECIKHPILKEILETAEYTTSPTAQHPQGLSMSSTTLSFAKDSLPYLLGGKTGFTYEAGLCLASYAHVKNMDLILVTAHADATLGYDPLHIYDARTLYNYTSEHYQQARLLEANQTLADVKVAHRFKDNHIFWVNDQPIDKIIDASIDVSSLQREVVVEELTAPLAEGTLVATLKIKNGDEVIYQKEYHLQQGMEESWVFRIFTLKNILLFVVAAILLFVGVLCLLRFLHIRRMRSRRYSRYYSRR